MISQLMGTKEWFEIGLNGVDIVRVNLGWRKRSHRDSIQQGSNKDKGFTGTSITLTTKLPLSS